MPVFPNVLYEHLEKDLLPKYYPSKSPLDLLEGEYKFSSFRRSRRRRRRRKRGRAVRRSLLLLGNVSVIGIELTGIRSTYGDLFLSKYGDELSLAGKYKNEIKKPTRASVVQAIGDVSEKMVVYFMPEATYDLVTKYKIDRPLVLGCSGEIISGPWRDSITDSYPIGIFDDTFKPTAEYPVAGVDNVVLDLAYTWGVKNVIYPLPLASELSIDNIKIEMVSGFHRFEGKYYKDAASNNTIRLKYRLRNIGNKTIKTKHWGTPLTVMFDDDSHVSQMDVNVGVSDRTIGVGGATNYELTLNIPAWAYGKICLCHALKVYKDGMPIYNGGPMCNFEIGRLRLP